MNAAWRILIRDAWLRYYDGTGTITDVQFVLDQARAHDAAREHMARRWTVILDVPEWPDTQSDPF